MFLERQQMTQACGELNLFGCSLFPPFQHSGNPQENSSRPPQCCFLTSTAFPLSPPSSSTVIFIVSIHFLKQAGRFSLKEVLSLPSYPQVNPNFIYRCRLVHDIESLYWSATGCFCHWGVFFSISHDLTMSVGMQIYKSSNISLIKAQGI